MLYPLTFRPIFKERLWGSRRLQSLYGKELPANLPIGESWEISDRPGDVSVVADGPLAGEDLHALLDQKRPALLGPNLPPSERFPLLVKILDAEQTLSLQVHPPAAAAAKLQGEPKTELWYVAHAAPDAALFVGLRRGVTREEFEERLRTGTVAECIHRVPVRAGDAMFVPSGRVHGIGAGCVIFEIQQNSDTTYRVFDWNRVDRNGQARELHLSQSMASIDFNDFEPGLIETTFAGSAESSVRPLVEHELFAVEARRLCCGRSVDLDGGGAVMLGVLSGALQVVGWPEQPALGPGRFCLLPASLEHASVTAMEDAEFLVIHP
jgi:mannose-6-phosphate isomerase